MLQWGPLVPVTVVNTWAIPASDWSTVVISSQISSLIGREQEDQAAAQTEADPSKLETWSPAVKLWLF